MAVTLFAAVLVAAILVLIAILAYTAWLNSHNEACLGLVTSIWKKVKEVEDHPDTANVSCGGIKKSITQFNNQCPGYSVPQYTTFVPPCMANPP